MTILCVHKINNLDYHQAPHRIFAIPSHEILYFLKNRIKTSCSFLKRYGTGIDDFVGIFNKRDIEYGRLIV